MLEKARDKKIYDGLDQADFLSFMSGHKDSYDAVLGAATLISTGLPGGRCCAGNVAVARPPPRPPAGGAWPHAWNASIAAPKTAAVTKQCVRVRIIMKDRVIC